MKKVISLFIAALLILGNSSLVFADGQSDFSLNPYDGYYEGNNLIIEVVLSNTGNRTLQNVSSLDIEVYDASDKNIANVTIDHDDWLSELSLQPGESTYWELQIEGAEKGDISSFKTVYSADFESIGDDLFTSGTLIVINNESLQTEVDPFIDNGTTLVPLRAIFEKLGADVKWDSKTQTVTATRNGNVVKLTIGNKYLTVNEEKVTFDASAKIVNSSTMVPLRAISESFGGNVSYGKTGDAVTISIRID